MIPDLVAPAPTAPQTSTDAGSHGPGSGAFDADLSLSTTGLGLGTASDARGHHPHIVKIEIGPRGIERHAGPAGGPVRSLTLRGTITPREASRRS